jgi:4-diphosphocytidyl-2-C-methyl-D-erythritol kinase
MLTVTAPAKLNLTLEILKKREDGYHEIRSLVQTLNLCDRLRFSASPRMEFKCDLGDWEASRSLVPKAAELMRAEVGTDCSALIEISKRIPMSSGLGGDSSDAVATLRGLNLLWKLNLSLPQLIKMAEKLGSDTSLFLYGGTLVVEGRGEKISLAPVMGNMSVIILFPSIPEVKNKTQQLYAQIRARQYTTGQFTDEFIARLKIPANSPSSGLYNVFDEVGLNFFKGLKDYKRIFEAAGANEVHLAGSGPTLFSIFKDPVVADTIYNRLEKQKLEVCLAGFS